MMLSYEKLWGSLVHARHPYLEHQLQVTGTCQKYLRAYQRPSVLMGRAGELRLVRVCLSHLDKGEFSMPRDLSKAMLWQPLSDKSKVSATVPEVTEKTCRPGCLTIDKRHMDNILAKCTCYYVSMCVQKRKHIHTYPPAQNQYMQEEIIGELIFARIHVGPVFALARIQEIFLRDNFPHVSQILEDFISVRMHVAPVFAPARTQEKAPGELFVYWFCARGTRMCVHVQSFLPSGYTLRRDATTPFLESYPKCCVEVLGSGPAKMLRRRERS